MREKDIEAVLTREIKNLGGKAYKWVSPGNDGVPDRIVILPGRVPIFVELKTVKGRLTELQEIQIGKLTDLGQDVRVLHGLADVGAFLDECSEEMKRNDL